MMMPPRAAPLAGVVDAGTEFGTMLEIRSVQMLPDGRSMVETWGTHRFRILEHRSLDGYMIGRVERIDDYEDLSNDWESEIEEPAASSSSPSSPSSPSSSSSPTTPITSPPSQPLLSRMISDLSGPPTPTYPPLSTIALLQTCHTFLEQLRAGTAPWVVQRLNHSYGPQPPDEDPAAFSFWMAMVLPIDEHEKAKLLPIKSARLRLRMIVGWIEQLNSNW